MGKMSKEQILSFAKEFAEKMYEIGWYSLDEAVIRTLDIVILLDYLVQVAEAEAEGHGEEFKKHFKFPDGWYESKERLADIVPRVAEDETIEAVMLCEGELWKSLYYCEAYGSNDDRTKALYQAFLEMLQKHHLWYEWGSGIVFLYGVLD